MPKSFTVSASFKAAPAALFDAFANPAVGTEATGSKFSGDCRAGARFAAFDRKAGGVTLRVVKNRSIVRTWRSAGWDASIEDAILVLAFTPEGEGSSLTVTMVGLPGSEVETLKSLWKVSAFEPIKAWLKLPAGKSAKKTSVKPGQKRRGRPAGTKASGKPSVPAPKKRGRPRKERA
ncbi:MAG: SRPBCC domain-containing protein [Spirochaetes bacterium]|nr:SRPBCC domain-containing protein [Spirochaetota bacterium]